MLEQLRCSEGRLETPANRATTGGLDALLLFRLALYPSQAHPIAVDPIPTH